MVTLVFFFLSTDVIVALVGWFSLILGDWDFSGIEDPST